MHRLRVALLSSVAALACAGFPDTPPETTVVLDNRYPPSSSETALVVYQAYWLNVAFQTPVLPGASSDPQATAAASTNAAYVVLAPGWDPTSGASPTSFVVLESRSGFAVELGDTLHIPVDDTTFEGRCATGSPLAQDRADFLTQIVFAGVFAGLHYDAATCTTTPIGDAGGA